MEILTKVHARHLVEWAKDKPEVVVLSADLTSSSEADLFRNQYPDRFMSMGIAEQNMISVAGGLAREGFKPFVHTFAVFIYRRAYDQVAMSVAYPNLPVRLIGFLPGITTPGGATHQAIEDIAVMRALPNMIVLECGDATEVETILEATESIDGPVYIRMIRGEIPRLFNPKEPFKLNQPRILSDGDDITLFSSGICTEEAMRASRFLKEQGVGVRHLHISTLKPFGGPIIQEAIQHAKYGVITMENHSIIGGLGTVVSETIAESGIGKKLVRIGLHDKFAHGASRPYLMREYGLDAIALVKKVGELLSKDFDISENDLTSIRIEPVHSLAKAEGL